MTVWDEQATIVIDQYDVVEDAVEELERVNVTAALEHFKEEWQLLDPKSVKRLLLLPYAVAITLPKINSK